MGKRNKSRTRDANAISNQRLRFENDLLDSLVHDFPRAAIRQIDDGRRWKPGPDAGRRGLRSSSTRVTVDSVRRTPTAGKSYKTRNFSAFVGEAPSSRVAYEKPDEVATCVRRKERREVLHALRHSGKGGQKKPRWTQASKIACKRRR